MPSKKAPAKKAPSVRVRKPSAEQLRARREFIKSSGYSFSREELSKVAEQWRA